MTLFYFILGWLVLACLCGPAIGKWLAKCEQENEFTLPFPLD